MDLIIRQAMIAGYPGHQDIGIENGLITAISPRLSASTSEELSAEGRLVFPGFVDSHVHMDKAMTVTLDSFKNGTIAERVGHLNLLKTAFTKDDVCERGIAVAKLFARNGVLYIRTNVDVDPTVGLIGIEGMLEARERCKEFIHMQVFAFAQEGILRYPEVENLLERALQLGASGVGGHSSIEPNGNRHIDAIFKIAKKYRVDIDFHVDENADPQNSLLDYIISKTISEGYQGRVNAIHCAALALMDPNQGDAAIKRLAAAGINVTVCPGVVAIDCPLAPIERLMNHGVNVSFGADNIRDPINPLGTADPLILSYLASHLQKIFAKESILKLFAAVTTAGANTLGLGGQYAIHPGQVADLVVLDCDTPERAILDVPKRRDVIRAGRNIARLI